MKRIFKLLRIVFAHFEKNESPLRAASLAYYALFSLFPLGLFLIYLGGGVISEEGVRETLEVYVLNFVPVGAEKILNVVDHAVAMRGSIGLVGLAGLLWSASSVFGVLEGSLSKIWAGNPSPFWRRRLLGGAAVLALSALFVASFFFRPIIEWAWDNHVVFSKEAINFGVEFGISLIMSTLLFRIFPNREIPWRPAVAGAVFTSLAIELIQSVFGYYLAVVGRNFGLLYGSIAWVFALGIWVYLAGLVFFFGAEIGAAIDRGDHLSSSH